MKQILTTIRNIAIDVSFESDWMQILVYILQNLSLLIMIQDDHVHKFRRSCCNFLSHIVFFSILFTYWSAYNSKSDFLIQMMITTVLHEIFDRLRQVFNTDKLNALCFTKITISHHLFNKATKLKISILMKEDMTIKVELKYWRNFEISITKVDESVWIQFIRCCVQIMKVSDMLLFSLDHQATWVNEYFMIIKSLHDVIINVIVRIDADKACKVFLKDSVCMLIKKF